MQAVRLSVGRSPIVPQAAAIRGGVAADRAIGERRRAVFATPPPSVAELPMIVQAVSVAAPAFDTPPPLPVVEPPLIVRSESVAVNVAVDLEHADLAAAADRHRSGGRGRRSLPARLSRRAPGWHPG